MVTAEPVGNDPQLTQSGESNMSAMPQIEVALAATQRDPAPVGPTKVAARDVNVFYAEKQALKNVSVDIPEKAVTAFIGPSGCGKSTFLRCLNRMNDTIPIARVTGTIEIDGQNVNDPNIRCRSSFARASAWYFRSRIRFRSPFSRTSPTARASTAWRGPNPNSTIS